MKKTFFTLLSFLLVVPAVAQAQVPTPNFTHVDSLVDRIIRYARLGITFLMILATLFFIWAVIQYIRSDEKNRGERKKQMVTGIIGLFIIVSVWGIIYFIGNTLGIGAGSNRGNILPCPPGTVSNGRECI